MLPKKRKRGSAAVFSNCLLIDLISGWSGATPERTSPHGVGSISNMSTATPISSDASAAFSRDAAAKNPDGPEPTIATWYGRILNLLLVPGCGAKGLRLDWRRSRAVHTIVI